MQGVNTQHPDAEKLSAFGLGLLSEADSKVIELHLAECDACARLLEEVPADSLVDLLRSRDPGTLAGAANPMSDTDSTSPVPQSVPPLYKKLAEIIGGKPAAAPAPSPTPARDESVAASFTIPRELEGHPRYLVLAPLGAGGMGTVYKAQHRLMERVVALKMVNPVLVTRPGAVERFTREVKAAAQLVHPNIVTAFDAEKVGETHVLVMEFVDGRTLAQVQSETAELPVARACDYVRQTALGLQHALDRGMVHRDIKPQNLMLTPQGEIKILDFGLARFVSEQGSSDGSTEHGTLMGSPDYMAPEQGHDAHAADERADIYGMGCTLYHLLAGQVPFPASSLLGKLEAHRDQQAIPLNHLRSDIPAELAAVVAKMMAKDPAQRYQKPSEVAEALRPFTTEKAQPSSRAGELARPIPTAACGGARAPIYALVVAAALALLAGGYWLAQMIFRVETPQGTLIVKTDDPDVQVAVKSGGKVVELFFPKQKKTIPLKVGPYEIELVGGKQGLKLSTNRFEIRGAGDQKSVTVEFVPAPPPPPPSGPPKALPFPFSERDGQERQKEWAAHLKRDIVETNSIGMTLALIPPGEFPMTPEYRVRLTKPYYLGVHSVTVGQFKIFVKETGYRTDNEKNGGGWAFGIEKDPIGPKPEFIWSNREFSPTDDHPVVFVSWNDAVQFCAWLSLKEKKSYRLPTVAEREWAGRGGAMRDAKTAQLRGWFLAKSGKKSQPVGKLPADVLGLFDMYGNTGDSCQDWNGPLPKGLVIDPRGPDKGQYRLQAGGHFLHMPEDGVEPMSDWRQYLQNGGTNGFGIRVVCEVDAPEVSPPPVVVKGPRLLDDVVDRRKASLAADVEFVSSFQGPLARKEIERDKQGRLVFRDEVNSAWGDSTHIFTSDFVVEASATIVTPPHKGWGLGINNFRHGQASSNYRGVEVLLNSKGELSIVPSRFLDHDKGKIQSVGPIQVKNFNAAGRSNTLAVVVRGGQSLEIFVNGTEACPPVTLPEPLSHAHIQLATSGGEKGSVLAFERFKVLWLDAQPQPIAEWRQGRSFLTVAQSGPADFRTIQEALQAVKAGQYVKVLDKGPYRETLVMGRPPENIGLISDVGTRIEPASWHEWGPSPRDKTRKIYLGWRFAEMKGMRIHGFDITMPPLPKDTEYAHAMEMDGIGDIVIESCRVLRDRNEASPPSPGGQQAPPERWFLAFGCHQGKGRFLFQDNLIDGPLNLRGEHSAQATLRRNWIRAWNGITLMLPEAPGSEVTVTNNILQGRDGIVFRERGAEKAALGRWLIANNVIDIHNSPFWALAIDSFPEKDRPSRQRLSPHVTIRNNIIRSQSGTGLEALADDHKAVLGDWKLGHNSFTELPKQAGQNLPPLPKQASDLIVVGPFLSDDPMNRDYLRIPAQSRQARSGAGDDLPTYLGAFPPGPAPKDGDWFTRLQPASGSAAPAGIPTVEALLKTRKVLTVAQDGSGDCKTIQEALDKVQAGQVILIKKGKYPYRESPRATVPADVALVSQDGAEIEIRSGQENDVVWAADFKSRGDFRMSGLTWISDRPRGGPVVLVNLWNLLSASWIIDECSFIGDLRDPSIALRIRGTEDTTSKVLVQNCYFAGRIEAGFGHVDMTVERNWFAKAIGAFDFNSSQSGRIVVRNNVFQTEWGFRIATQLAKEATARPGIDLVVHNNVFDVAESPVSSFYVNAPEFRELGQLCRSVHVVNNIMRSHRNRGMILLPLAMDKVKDRWIMSPNVYSYEPTDDGVWKAWPKQASDRVLSEPYLTTDPRHADFLRVDAKGSLAKGGAGGDLPAYFGAFPPGPAPKDGDWFTRMQAKHISLTPPSHAFTWPTDIKSLPEFLKGRKILTVAQDGKAMFTTIAAALDKAKPGEAVQVLDKGPYRESLVRAVPDDVALVSEVGTRIEIPKWTLWGPDTEPAKKGKNVYQGWVFHSTRDFRLAGFEIVCPAVPADASYAIAVETVIAGEFLVESCRVVHTPRYDRDFTPRDLTGDDFIALRFGADVAKGRSIVRDNYFEGTVDFVRGDTSGLFMERNRVVSRGMPGGIRLFLTRAGETILRNNVIHAFNGIQINGQDPATVAKARFLIANNIIDVRNTPVWSFTGGKYVLPSDVRIQNNIVQSQVGNNFMVYVSDARKANTAWQVSNNAYVTKLRDPNDLPKGEYVLPSRPTDLTLADAFLSGDRADWTTYGRIALAGPLSKAGAGGDLPAYIGAFPPGPAPKAGDWFTRLRGRAPRAVSWPADALRESRISAPDISKAKNILQDGWATAKNFGPEFNADKSVSAGLVDGLFYIQHEKPGWSGWNWPGLHSSVVAVAEGRVTDALSNEWGLNFMYQPKAISLLAMINGEGRLRVVLHDHGKADREPPLVDVKHPAIKLGKEFNKVAVILRGPKLEVYVNDIAVCDPMIVDLPTERVNIHPQMVSNKKGRVEFRHFSVWSADGIPTPEERLERGEVPVKIAPKQTFAWPAEALRGGRIPAPDLSKAALLYDAKLNEPKEGFGKSKTAFSESGYESGVYFVAVKPGAFQAHWPSCGPFADFAVESEGRVSQSTSGEWSLEIQNRAQKRGLHFRINGESELVIELNEIAKDGKKEQLGRYRHDAIKKGDAFNKLLLLSRSNQIEVYVNGVAICNPIPSPIETPSQIAIGAFSAKNQSVRAEYRYIRVYSAKGVPTPEERRKNGEPAPKK